MLPSLHSPGHWQERQGKVFKRLFHKKDHFSHNLSSSPSRNILPGSFFLSLHPQLSTYWAQPLPGDGKVQNVASCHSFASHRTSSSPPRAMPGYERLNTWSLAYIFGLLSLALDVWSWTMILYVTLGPLGNSLVWIDNGVLALLLCLKTYYDTPTVMLQLI